MQLTESRPLCVGETDVREHRRSFSQGDRVSSDQQETEKH